MSNFLSTVETDDILALIFVAFLITFVRLEFRHPFLMPGLKTLKKSYLTNISTYLFNDLTLSFLSIPSLFFVAQQFSGVGLLSSLGDGPLKYLITFVLLDLTMYLWHYTTHHIDALWTFHKVHHSDKTLNVTTGLRFHMGELIMEVLVRVAFIVILGVDPNVILVSQTLITLFVLFHHTNVKFPSEDYISSVFIVPSLHRVHHSVVREEHDSNYGAVFSFWDRLFGTLKMQEPTDIGLYDVDEKYLETLLKNSFTMGIVKRFNGLLATFKSI